MKRLFRLRYGEYSHRQIMEYVRHARDEIAEARLIPREQLRDQVREKLEAIILDRRSSPRDQLMGLKQLAELCGLNSPALIAQTDSEGRDIDRSPEQTRALLIEQLRKMRETESAN